MRNMDVIELTQTVGRVFCVLAPAAEKTYGLCVVPSYSQVGISTAKALQKVVDIVFEQG